MTCHAVDGKYGDVNFGFKRCITLGGASCGKEKNRQSILVQEATQFLQKSVL